MVNVLIQVSYYIILLLRSLKCRHSCFLTISCKRLCGGNFSSFALSKPADAPCFSRLWRTNFLQVPECELPFHLSQTSQMLVTVSRTHLPLSFASSPFPSISAQMEARPSWFVWLSIFSIQYVPFSMLSQVMPLLLMLYFNLFTFPSPLLGWEFLNCRRL